MQRPQSRLRIGPPEDALEREADRVADQVMRMSEAGALSSAPVSVQRKCAHCQEEEEAKSSSAPPIQRKCAACEEEELVQKKPESLAGSAQPLGHDAPASVHAVLRSPGEPLASRDLAFFQSRFGFDFSRVRIHADRAGAESARSVNALAYTSGFDIAFAAGRYRPGSDSGRRLLAHELTHVVQQTAHSSPASGTASSVRPPVLLRATPGTLQCHKDDLVAYGGGQSSRMMVFNAGKLDYVAPAVSGHPGHGANEPNAGPIPPGRYTLHPQITQPTVTTLQDGTCGARDIATGYQELTSNDPSPCEGAHYCNVPCPAPGKPDQKCFTPVDCWGPKRIRIEGTQNVVTPGGKKVTRFGFYIHGGNHADAVSSGCAKTLDNDIFDHIRKLTGVRGAVPFCVGDACPPSAQTAALLQETTDAVSDVAHAILPSVF